MWKFPHTKKTPPRLTMLHEWKTFKDRLHTRCVWNHLYRGLKRCFTQFLEVTSPHLLTQKKKTSSTMLLIISDRPALISQYPCVIKERRYDLTRGKGFPLYRLISSWPQIKVAGLAAFLTRQTMAQTHLKKRSHAATARMWKHSLSYSRDNL